MVFSRLSGAASIANSSYSNERCSAAVWTPEFAYYGRVVVNSILLSIIHRRVRRCFPSLECHRSVWDFSLSLIKLDQPRPSTRSRHSRSSLSLFSCGGPVVCWGCSLAIRKTFYWFDNSVHKSRGMIYRIEPKVVSRATYAKQTRNPTGVIHVFAIIAKLTFS